MYILTPENKSLETARIPQQTNSLHYCVLDYGNEQEVDYKFPPVVFLEDFSRAGAELKIGKYNIQVPLNWSILLGDKDFGDLEIVPLVSFNGRDFSAFVFNPCKGYMPDFYHVEIINIYQEIRWCVPIMNSSQMLAIPLTSGENPPCIFMVDSKNKLPEVLDIRKLF